MAKVVKNVSFSWSWTGDERLLQGFNVALCKSTETPLTAITASTFIAMRGTSETPVTLTPSYIFSNVLLDEGLYYIPFVQAVYPGDDSEWLGSTGVLVEDDGTSTVAMDSTLPVVFFQATTPSGKFGDTWVDTDDGNKSYYHNGTSWIEGKYGIDGVNGTRTAILEMYQGAVSIPTTFPSGSSTYTWATGQFTAPATPNSWELTPPALDAGETLWICRTVYADTGTSTTTSITWPTTNYARAASSNGADGANGARTAVLEVYRWLPTGTSSFTYPSGSSTYTWATGVFDLPATPNSWSLLPGAATEGYTLFACRVVFTDTLTTATSSVSWTGVTSAYAVGVAGISGISALVGMLTNESHTVAALVTGLGYSLTTAGGTFKVYSGTTDVTTSSTFSISGGTDGGTSWTKVQNGLTFTINETTGVYSLSGASWTTDNESFTAIGTYAGTAISKVYTISKSIAGAVGAAADVVTVTGEQAFKFLTGSATPVSSSITLTSVLNGSLTTYDWEYWTGSAWANLSGTQNSNTYALAYNNAAWGSATALRVRCLSGTVFDEITVVKLYDGATGPSGNSTYTATIYKQVATDPGSPVATASTYNFATGVLTPPSGWLVVQPATTTTPTWACEYTFSGLPSATVTGVGSWGATRIDAVAGAAGNGGVSIAVVEMYKVGGGTLPTGTTFTFSTGLVSGTLNGWSQTMPVSSSQAIYMTTCRFTATAPTDTQVNSSWTTAIIVSQLALVGGRNFALNSSLMVDGDLWAVSGGTFPGTGLRMDSTTANMDAIQVVALLPSTAYTVSFDVVDCSALSDLRAYVVERVSATVNVDPYKDNVFTPTVIGRNSFTFTTAATCTLGRLYLRVLATTKFGIFKNYQIEEGNKASSWREAPEDTQARLVETVESAVKVIVTADRQLSFTATDGSIDTGQSNIVLTANAAGLTTPTYAWTFGGLDSNPATTNAQTCTITPANFGTSKSAWAKCTVNGNASYVGTVTIVRLELSTGVPGAGSGVNILRARYSGFEQNTAPSFNQSTSLGVATVDTVGWRASSLKSLKLTHISGTYSYASFGTSISDFNTPITASKKWIMQARVKCSGSSKTGSLGIKDAAQVVYKVDFVTHATAGTWSLVSGVINASASTQTSCIPFVFNYGLSDMWFDDIMLEEQIGSGTTPSSYIAPLWSITDTIQTVISGINLPTTGMVAGLNITQTYLGYYDGSAWKSYIDNAGNFKFGDGSTLPGIAWNQAAGTLAIRGAIVADDITSGTLTAIDITGSTITGATVTGTTIQTASSGKRLAIYASNYSDPNLAGEFRIYDDLGGIGGIVPVVSIGLNLNTGDTSIITIGNVASGNGFTGIKSYSNSGYGLYGSSISYIGIHGLSAGTTANAAGVFGSNSNSGPGISGYSVSGYGGIFTGNATKAPLNLASLSTLPTNRTAGSVCYYDGWLCFADGLYWLRSDGTIIS